MRTDKPTGVGDTIEKLKKTLVRRQKYIKNEFQAYGLQLAEELGDWNNRSLYIRLAKQVDRKILEKARLFIKDQSPGAIKTPYKLFMWKLKELRNLSKQIKTN